jgi:hypothetical protein
MAFFIFTKNQDNQTGTLYRICENQSDLNNLNIIQSDYKIIEDSQNNFNDFKLNNKIINGYNNETILYENINIFYNDKDSLNKYIKNIKLSIKYFLESNINHSLFNQWNSYYNQLNNLNLDNITYPLNKSLEQYFNDLGQPSFNILQLP